MKRIRTLVVDDEQIARSRIRKLLETDLDIDLVGECGNGTEAVSMIKQKKPDLVFLDIQMPDLDGFGVIDKLDPHTAPVIIFATAYHEYALKAFDVHAIDYLLKPFDDDRFVDSLEKAKEQLKMKTTSQLTQKLLRAMKDIQHEHSSYARSILIKDRGRETEVNLDDVIYAEAEGNYVNFEMKSRHYLYRITMNALAADLDPTKFLRVHRSFIVNREKVATVKYNGNNEFLFTMDNDHQITSGRSYKESIGEFLEEHQM